MNASARNYAKHDGSTAELASFLADLKVSDIPHSVFRRTEELFLDWIGSALAGWQMHPVPLFDRFARAMGPDTGRCEILGGRRNTTALFAAFVNGASSHVAEQDDLHNSSVLHPATVVFPAVLAAAQDRCASGEAILIAAIAGYEAGIRVGEFLGRTHYQKFHTTATAGTIAAAVAVAKLIGDDKDILIHAIGNAGTQAAGLWEFLQDAADSKQLHAAKAASNGIIAAYMAADGLSGARHVLEGSQGMGAAMSRDADPKWLTDRLGTRWATAETSFKHHASCRHTHPSADALLLLMERDRIGHKDIASIEAHVHQAAIDVLGRVESPQSVHQAKFSMGTMLGLIAVHRNAGLDEFELFALNDPNVARIRTITRMVFDSEIDAMYPSRWQGRVEICTTSGRKLEAFITEPKGDPGNALSRPELEAKFRRLGARAGCWSGDELDDLISRVWAIRDRVPVGSLQ